MAMLFRKSSVSNNNVVTCALLLIIIVLIRLQGSQQTLAEKYAEAKLSLWKSWEQSASRLSSPSRSAHSNPGAKRDVSPFKNTLAYIRLNSDAHPERIPMLMQYAPFFHTIHISHPNNVIDSKEYFLNLTHDNYWSYWTGYGGVANVMELLLNISAEESSVFSGERNAEEITGIWFMHFDAWLDPLKFWDIDFERIWVLDSASMGVGDGAPYYVCMKDKSRYSQWHWLNTPEDNESRMWTALRAVSRGPEGYDVGSPEYCSGYA